MSNPEKFDWRSLPKAEELNERDLTEVQLADLYRRRKRMADMRGDNKIEEIDWREFPIPDNNA